MFKHIHTHTLILASEEGSWPEFNFCWNLLVQALVISFIQNGEVVDSSPVLLPRDEISKHFKRWPGAKDGQTISIKISVFSPLEVAFYAMLQI